MSLPMIEFKFVGYQRVENKLRMLASEHPEIYEESLTRWAGTMRGKLKSRPYPAQRPGQKYIRTGQLANRWRVERDGPGKVSITNAAQSKGRYYGPYVVGDGAGKEQAWMHKDRWWLAADVVKEDTAALTQQMARELTNYWGSAG